jgi:hypothetical protein
MLFQGSNTFYNITTNILKLDLIMVFLIYGIMDKSMFQLYYKVSGKIMVLEIAGKIMVLEMETLQWVRFDLSLLIGKCGSPHNNSYNSTRTSDI